jgi:hypothetical protein
MLLDIDEQMATLSNQSSIGRTPTAATPTSGSGSGSSGGNLESNDDINIIGDVERQLLTTHSVPQLHLIEQKKQ